MRADRLPHSMTNDPHEAVKAWLLSEGMEPKPTEDPRAEFHYLIRYPPGPHGHTFNVLRPKEKDLIALSSMTRVDAGQQGEMKKHSTEDLEGWAEWMHLTRISLIDSGVDWSIHVGGDKKKGDGPLQAFNVSEPIWFDGLSKNAMMQSLRRLWMAKLTLIHEIKHNYGSGTGKRGPVDDFEKKGGGAKKMVKEDPTPHSEVETDDSGSFGAGFDPSEWV